jgi:hypothetical protein
MSPLPDEAENNPTISSGSEVPKAITVSPITKSEILKYLANEEAEDTNKEAPLIRI